MDSYMKLMQAEVELREAVDAEGLFKALNSLIEASSLESGTQTQDIEESLFPVLGDVQRKYYRYLKKCTGYTSFKEALAKYYIQDPENFPIMMKVDSKGRTRLYPRFESEPTSSTELDPESQLDGFRKWVNAKLAVAKYAGMESESESFRAASLDTVKLMQSDQKITTTQAIGMIKESPECMEFVQKIDALG